MKFLTNSLNGILRRFGATAMLAFALVLSVCANSYASTPTPTLRTATNSPMQFYEKSKNLFQADGVQPAPGKLSIEPANKFTNFTGSETFRFSAINRLSNCGS